MTSKQIRVSEGTSLAHPFVTIAQHLPRLPAVNRNNFYHLARLRLPLINDLFCHQRDAIIRYTNTPVAQKDRARLS